MTAPESPLDRARRLLFETPPVGEDLPDGWLIGNDTWTAIQRDRDAIHHVEYRRDAETLFGLPVQVSGRSGIVPTFDKALTRTLRWSTRNSQPAGARVIDVCGEWRGRPFGFSYVLKFSEFDHLPAVLKEADKAIRLLVFGEGITQ